MKNVVRVHIVQKKCILTLKYFEEKYLTMREQCFTQPLNAPDTHPDHPADAQAVTTIISD